MFHVIDSALYENIFVIALLIKSDNQTNMFLFKIFNVHHRRQGDETLLGYLVAILRSCKGKKLTINDPVKVAVFNKFIMLIFICGVEGIDG
jgi:hypothetical protein